MELQSFPELVPTREDMDDIVEALCTFFYHKIIGQDSMLKTEFLHYTKNWIIQTAHFILKQNQKKKQTRTKKSKKSKN